MGLLTEPAGYVDGPNLYEFVGSNPVSLVDPNGLQATQPTTTPTPVLIPRPRPRQPTTQPATQPETTQPSPGPTTTPTTNPLDDTLPVSLFPAPGEWPWNGLIFPPGYKPPLVEPPRQPTLQEQAEIEDAKRK